MPAPQPSRSLVLLGALLAAHAASAAPPRLPEVPRGWKVEPVAQAPDILFPTAVVAAPEGTIYLGQDPMDMPGPPTSPIDSVVALEGGRVRTFAEGLWSVMGLEWVDGTLVAVHAPFLSAFRDTDGDGRADRRDDLVTGLGPDRPGASGLNDHIASGVRLGMDGFLYVAVGDKGIPKGVGKDGTTIRLQGGGVIRVRPDGTGLEVVSTGECNPLSVTLTAADEVFTFGNDDDSKRWPNSLTHHIVGGHYGYPYEFLTAPRRALPIVAGQVGGAGAQGLCYTDDGLPEVYRGNLFFCDWGLQVVSRFVVEKAGATFRLARAEALVTRGELDDFRPFSLAVDPSGGLLLVDWAYSGWLADGPKTGRLFRLTYDGPGRADPSPPPARSDDIGLIAALDHPAQSRRLSAQRALARRGERAVRPLVARLHAADPPAGRVHALWALDAIGTPEARQAVRSALADSDGGVRLQAARSAGIRRDRDALGTLSGLLRDADSSVRREAAIAIGKLGDPAAARALYDALAEPDPFAAWSVRGAIRRLGAWDEALLAAALLDPGRRDAALRLADEAWALPVVDALRTTLRRLDSAEDRARVVETLAGLSYRYPPWSGRWFGSDPLAGPFPRKTERWDPAGMGSVLRGLMLGLADRDPEVRLRAIVGLRDRGAEALPALRAALTVEADGRNLAALAEALGALRDPASAGALATLVRDARKPEPARAEALGALARIGGPEALRARFSLLYDPRAPAALAALALPALGREGVLPPNDAAGFLESPAPPIRAAALGALDVPGKLPAEVEQAVVARLDDPDASVRKAAAALVGRRKLRAAIPRLIAMAGSEGQGPEAALALAAMPDPRALPALLAALGDRSPEVRRAAESALRAIRDRVGEALRVERRSARLTGPAAEAVERVLSDFTPVRAWRVIGPFPKTTPQAFFGEPSIDFARPVAGLGGRPVAWAPRVGDSATGRVVLDDLRADAADTANAASDLGAFGYAEVVSETDRPALLLAGSSGTLRVTLNEVLVYQAVHPAGRPYLPDADAVRVTLRRGTNRLLVASRRGIGAWSFSVQVSAPSADLGPSGPSTPSAEELRAFALAHPGDERKGEALFFAPQGIGCARCHSVGGRGTGRLGPDLAGLARTYDRAEIVRSVLEPSARIATGYQPVLIALTDGRVLTGLVRSETDAQLEIIDAEARVVHVSKSDIEERRIGNVSLMPERLAETLSPLEFADLISYLASLRRPPGAAAPGGS